MKSLSFAVCLFGGLVISACTTTTPYSDIKHGFKQKVSAVGGGNPYIQDPVYKDLETRLLKVALADAVTNDINGNLIQRPNAFASQSRELLKNFDEQYDHVQLTRLMSLADQGFEAASTALYSSPGVETACKLTEPTTHAYFAFSDEPSRISWRFQQGDCKNGVADGIGIATGSPGPAHFVGRFENGVLSEGVAEIPYKETGRQLIIGKVAQGADARRVLMAYRNSQDGENASYFYADQTATGRLDGFSILVWQLDSGRIVKQVGPTRDATLHGFAARQDRRDLNAQGNKVWYTWMGQYEDGFLNGPGGWTDGFEKIELGNWVNGEINKDGVSYAITTDYQTKRVILDYGNYRNGKLDGENEYIIFDNYNDLSQYAGAQRVFRDGEEISDKKISSGGSGFDFGKAVAIAGVGGVLGASGLSLGDAAPIGAAFAADVLGDTDGSNMGALQSQLETHIAGQRNAADATNGPATQATISKPAASASAATSTTDVGPQTFAVCRTFNTSGRNITAGCINIHSVEGGRGCTGPDDSTCANSHEDLCKAAGAKIGVPFEVFASGLGTFATPGECVAACEKSYGEADWGEFGNRCAGIVSHR